MDQNQADDAAPRIAEAYAIVDRMGRLEGIVTIGEVFGQTLVATGRKNDGIAILRRSLEGYRKLGREQDVERLQSLIAKIESKE